MKILNKFKLIIFILAIGTVIILNQATKQEKIYAAQSQYVNHVVKQGECLSTIAYKYKGWRSLSNFINEIKFQNNLTNDGINEGQLLIIPVES